GQWPRAGRAPWRSAPPSRPWGGFLSVLVSFRGDRQTQLALPHDRVVPGDVGADGPQSAVVVQLTGGHLEAQVEQLFLGFLQTEHQLLGSELTQLGRSHSCGPFELTSFPR